MSHSWVTHWDQITPIWIHLHPFTLIYTNLPHLPHPPMLANIFHYFPLFATICSIFPLFAAILPTFANICHYFPLFSTVCYYLPLFAPYFHYLQLFCQYLPTNSWGLFGWGLPHIEQLRSVKPILVQICIYRVHRRPPLTQSLIWKKERILSKSCFLYILSRLPAICCDTLLEGPPIQQEFIQGVRYASCWMFSHLSLLLLGLLSKVQRKSENKLRQIYDV